jgi:hypothetical protein
LTTDAASWRQGLDAVQPAILFAAKESQLLDMVSRQGMPNYVCAVVAETDSQRASLEALVPASVRVFDLNGKGDSSGLSPVEPSPGEVAVIVTVMKDNRPILLRYTHENCVSVVGVLTFLVRIAANDPLWRGLKGRNRVLTLRIFLLI